MSRFEFKLPDIGEGVMEGEIVKWLVKPGDAIGEDQPMVEVMTDKATVTITSPKAGKVIELAGAEGAVIPVHATLVVLQLGNGAVEPAADGKAENEVIEEDGPAATAVGDIRETLPGMSLMGTAPPAPKAAAPAGDGYFNAKPLATPATRKLARDLSIDLRNVSPTGAHGRVLKADVQRFADGMAAAPTPTGAIDRSSVSAPLPAAPAFDTQSAEREVRRPLKGVRKRIFDAMAYSKHTAAHFTFVEECDVSALKAVRGRLKPLAAKQDVRLTFLPFFVKAVVAALKKHPILNSAYDPATQEIVERRYFNIGIASATEAGLMVPVVKDADRRSLLSIAKEIARLGEATKSGRIAADDLRGSTFTITSLGQQGGLFATPILNTPEVGILGIHQMKQKPVVRDGAIVIGDVMLLSLSFDHRLIDGHIGAAFAYEIINYLQDPELLWLDS